MLQRSMVYDVSLLVCIAVWTGRCSPFATLVNMRFPFLERAAGFSTPLLSMLEPAAVSMYIKRRAAS
jgi:hypothetical protein